MKITQVIVCLFVTLITATWSHGQLVTFDFAALGGAEASANSNGNDPNVGGSTITRGSGLTASGNGGRFNATNWALGSINNAVSGNNYMEFTITPNSGCSFSITSVFLQMQRSGTGPSAIALRSSADGFAANLDQIYTIIDNAATQSFTFTFSLTSSTPVTFRIYMYAEAAGGSGGIGDGTGNDLVVNGTTSCGAVNTITTGTVSGGPFDVNCSGTTDSGSVSFTSSGTFTAGNVYTVQLSDASGSFAAPTAIGTLSSTANSGSINFTIPANAASGAGYLIRIVSDNPVTIGSSSSAFTIAQSGSCAGPHITSVLINSCSPGGCAEGHNEIIFGNTGSESLTVSPANFEIYYGNSPSPTTNYTNSLTTNPTTTAALNTEAGCPGTFVEGTGETLPANASFIVVRSTLCTDALDWSGLCGSGPIYVIYSTDADWSTGGNFVNSASGFRYFQTDITGVGGNYVYDYTWDSDDLTAHDDGDYVSFPPTGGLATTYGNNGCAIDPIVLSIEDVYMEAVLEGDEAKIKWITSSETDNDFFLLEHSTNGINWQFIDEVQGQGTTQLIHTYNSIHRTPEQGINYYRLRSVDIHGKRKVEAIVALKKNGSFVTVDHAGSQLIFGKTGNYSIYSLEGKLVGEVVHGETFGLRARGTFFVHDQANNLVQKVVIF